MLKSTRHGLAVWAGEEQWQAGAPAHRHQPLQKGRVFPLALGESWLQKLVVIQLCWTCLSLFYFLSITHIAKTFTKRLTFCFVLAETCTYLFLTAILTSRTVKKKHRKVSLSPPDYKHVTSRWAVQQYWLINMLLLAFFCTAKMWLTT